MNTPRNGSTMMKMIHITLAKPLALESRKMSANTRNTSMIHRKKRKNQSIDQKTWTRPNVASMLHLLLRVPAVASTGLRQEPPSTLAEHLMFWVVRHGDSSGSHDVSLSPSSSPSSSCGR